MGAIMLPALLAGHFLADYPLQGDYLARSKNRHDPLGANLVWIQSLVAHSWIHAFFVYLITGSLFLGFCEFFVHGITDYYKCEGKISHHVDQFIHIGSKFLWAFLV